jgi:hypothetical protein
MEVLVGNQFVNLSYLMLLEYPPMMPSMHHSAHVINPRQGVAHASSERALLDLDLNRVVTVQRVPNPNIQPQFRAPHQNFDHNINSRLPPVNSMSMKAPSKKKLVYIGHLEREQSQR